MRHQFAWFPKGKNGLPRRHGDAENGSNQQFLFRFLFPPCLRASVVKGLWMWIIALAAATGLARAAETPKPSPSMPTYSVAVRYFTEAVKLEPTNAVYHYHLGNALLDDQKPTEALAEFQKAVELKPDYLDAHRQIQETLKAMGRLDEARQTYRKKYDADPKDVNGKYLWARLEADRSESLRLFDDALAAGVAGLWVHYDAAKAFEAAGRDADAKKQYQLSITERADEPNLYYNLGRLSEKERNLDEAAQSYTYAVKLKPDFAEAHNNLGTVRAAQGKPSEAITEYKKAIELDPKSALYHFNLANALLGVGQATEAEAEYKAAIERKSDYASAHCNLGNLYAQQHNADEAVTEYRRGIVADANLPEAHLGLAVMLAKLGKGQEAESEYKTAVTLQPDLAAERARFEAAVAGTASAAPGWGASPANAAAPPVAESPAPQVAAPNPPPAASASGTTTTVSAPDGSVITVQADPNTAEGQFAWGKKALEVKDDKQAQDCFEKATQMKPDWAEAVAYYGYARGRTNHFDDELDLCRRAAKMKKKSAEIRYLLAIAWLDQGKDSDAEDEFREAISLDPKFAPPYYRLGKLLNSQEQWKKALKSLQEYVKLEPQGPDADNARAMIDRIKTALDR